MMLRLMLQPPFPTRPCTGYVYIYIYICASVQAADGTTGAMPLPSDAKAASPEQVSKP